MTPSHHSPDTVLAEYALGTASPALALMVATHLTLCPTCRARVEALEAIGGRMLEDEAETALQPGEIDALMALLDGPPPAEKEPGPSDPAGVFPRPLVRYIGGVDAQRWQWRLPSVRAVDVPAESADTLPLRVVRLNRGYRLPVHDHAGVERAVILAGGWEDQTGEYHRGDFFYADTELREHDQRCFPDEDCILLVLNDAAIVPRNPFIRWVLKRVPPL
ncbi:MAG: putative transcriptional regulator [Myxococcota bacterium]|jgi:putative transcriptional regulator